MLEFLPATRRRRLAELDLKYREKDRTLNRGQAFVVGNSSVRGALTAIHWLAKPVYPVKVVETFEDGLAWAQRQLASASAAT
jgi:hypothetical protein